MSSDSFWAASIPERAAGLAQLREREPVAFFPEPATYGPATGAGYYALTRFDDVMAVSRNPSTFLSGDGSVTIAEPPAGFSEAFGPSLLHLDAPRHTRLRRIVSKGFTPRQMGATLANVTRLSKEIVDDVIELGECDAVSAITGRLPLKIICDLMGIPESQYEFVVTQTNLIAGSTDPEYLSPGVDPFTGFVRGCTELAALMADLGAHRQANPADDLTSVLVNAEIDGEKLTPPELAGFFNLLITAGNETTRNAISWGLTLLTENPDQRDIWLADLDAVTPTAVEEVLRCASPVIYMRRTLAADATVGDHALSAGDKVVMFYWAANRDPAHFPDPDRFDVQRTPNQHIAFGAHGPHFCLGAHLARHEITVMFRELLTRVPDIHTTAPPERLQSMFFNSIKRLPVAFTPYR